MAELADALDLGSSARKGMGVRLPPFAPEKNSLIHSLKDPLDPPVAQPLRRPARTPGAYAGFMIHFPSRFSTRPNACVLSWLKPISQWPLAAWSSHFCLFSIDSSG